MKIVKSLEELMSFLNIKKNDKIQLITPQFGRDYELEIDFVPQNSKELTTLIENTPKNILKKMGVGIWCTYKSEKEDGEKTYLKPGEIHYLFPGEWYDHIPEGFEIIDIFGEKEKFEHGKTDNDIRFGGLSYGFIRNF